ncbi:MAG: hypothetical protein V3S10_06395 [Dehalococcoidales bacterium]
MEPREDEERVLVPVRRREAIRENEIPEEPAEEEGSPAWQAPRRWRIY